MARVLLVDDDVHLAAALARLLGKRFELVQAASGEEALQLAGTQTFDAALIDKNLPGMDGLEVIRHLRQRQPRCGCLMMTGRPSIDSAVAALRLGAVDYLVKPSPELDVVAKRISEVVERGAATPGDKGLEAEVKRLRAELRRKDDEIARQRIELALLQEMKKR